MREPAIYVFEAIPESWPGEPRFYFEPLRLCCPELWAAEREATVDFIPDGPGETLVMYHEDTGMDIGDELDACPFCKRGFEIRIRAGR